VKAVKMNWNRSSVYFRESEDYYITQAYINGKKKYYAFRKPNERLGGPYETPEQALLMCEAYEESDY
jgi:hypothetical protein